MSFPIGLNGLVQVIQIGFDALFDFLLDEFTLIGFGFVMGRIRDEHAACNHPKLNGFEHNMVKDFLDNIAVLKSLAIQAQGAVIRNTVR